MYLKGPYDGKSKAFTVQPLLCLITAEELELLFPG